MFVSKHFLRYNIFVKLLKTNLAWIKVPPVWENPFLMGLLALCLLWFIFLNQLRVDWSINPQYSYGLLMPFLGGYLLLRRWEERPELQPPSIGRSYYLCIALIALSVFLLLPVRLVLEANPDWRLVSWALAGCVVVISSGIIYLAGGIKWLKHFAFPIMFMLLAVPWPTVLEQGVIQWMMKIVASISVEMLNWCGIFALQQGNLIRLPSGLVGVDEACSGVRSFQSTLVSALFIGELLKLNLLRRFILLTAGIVISFVLNSLRAFILAFIHVEQGASGLEKYHDPAGYVILAITFCALLGLGYGLVQLSAPTIPSIASNPSLPRWVWIGLIGWILLSELGTEAWYRGHERNLAARTSWELQWPEESEEFQFKKISETVENILRYSEGTQGIFTRRDGSVWSIFELIWAPGRVSAQLARSHSPEVCLPAAGARMVGAARNEVWSINELQLPMQIYTFQSGTQTWLVYYCVWEDREVKSDLEDPQDFYLYSKKLESVLKGRRHLGQRVLQIIVSGNAPELQTQEEIHHFLLNRLKVRY